MYKLVEIDADQLDAEKYHDFAAKTIYTTKEWLRFIERTQRNVQVKVLEIYEHDRFAGYFTGGVVTVGKVIRILGSPFHGWNTPCMGFDLYDPHIAINILPEIVRYFRARYHCLYAQVSNMYFSKAQLMQHGLAVQSSGGFQTDLTQSEEKIFAKFSRGARANVQRFTRLGCRVEEDYTQEFVDAYWEQLSEVFGRQGLTPSYDKKRVAALIEELRKRERILCIKAVTPEGLCPATLIQVGYGYLTTTVGCPSYLQYRTEYRPNEALMWHAIRHWKAKGAKIFDYGGGGAYKKKYGGAAIEYHTAYFSSLPGVFMLKELANKAYWRLNALRSGKSRAQECGRR